MSGESGAYVQSMTGSLLTSEDDDEVAALVISRDLGPYREAAVRKLCYRRHPESGTRTGIASSGQLPDAAAKA